MPQPSRDAPRCEPARRLSSLAPVIEQLVARIDSEWRRVGFAQADFPQISCEALSAVSPHALVDPVAILESLAAGEARDHLVGEHRSPQVVPLYAGPRFSLTLHLWQDHLQSPHSHAWCGAYQVLHGTSLHGSYSFEEESRYDSKLLLGKLRQDALEPLGPGAIVPVLRGGDRLIHGICYIDPLGLSLSTRSVENDPAMTHDYLDPGVAVQGSYVDRGTLERFRSLDALTAIDPEAGYQALAGILERSDPRTCFYWLRHAAVRYRSVMDLDGLFERAAPRFGRNADKALGGVATWAREALLRARRKTLVDVDHRFLFGALHQARDLHAVEQIVATRYPGPPRDFIHRVLTEMASTEGDPGWSLLGTPITSDFGPVLVALLDDPSSDAVLARLAEEYGAEDIGAMAPVLRDACDTLRALPTLRPLFAPRETAGSR